MKEKILVARPDRMGDVILSIPCLELLKKNFPSAEVHLLVKSAVAPLFENHPYVDQVHEVKSGFWNQVRYLKHQNFSKALVLQADRHISFAIRFAGIPVRVGPLSKWFSFFLFNKGLQQKRSHVRKHEMEYNLDLAALILNKRFLPEVSRFIAPVLSAKKESIQNIGKKLKEWNLSEFVVVHPGMGGSALNWPVFFYKRLIVELALNKIAVVITGSELERELVERVSPDFDSKLAVFRFVTPLSRAGLQDFTALLSKANVVVAPSTGPLHLASALGRPTVSFYPPILVQSQKRWGPISQKQGQSLVFSPKVECPEKFHCAGPRCSYYQCMESLSIEEALDAVLKQILFSKTEVACEPKVEPCSI